MGTKQIRVWTDETSDRDDPRIIVSIDEIDERGGAETTQTLRTFQDDREGSDQAGSYAAAQGTRLGLPVVVE